MRLYVTCIVKTVNIERQITVFENQDKAIDKSTAETEMDHVQSVLFVSYQGPLQ